MAAAVLAFEPPVDTTRPLTVRIQKPTLGYVRARVPWTGPVPSEAFAYELR